MTISGILVVSWLSYSAVNSQLYLKEDLKFGKYIELIEFLEKQKNNPDLSREKLGEIHIYLGASYEKIGKYEQAKINLVKAVEIYKEVDDILKLMAVLTDLAYINLLMGETQQVFVLTESVFELGANQYQLDWLLIAEKAHRVRGKAHLINKEYLQTFYNYNESLKLAQTIGKKELIARVRLSLSEAHKAQHLALLEDAEYSTQDGWFDSAKKQKEFAATELKNALNEAFLASSLDTSAQPLLTAQIQHELFTLDSEFADKKLTINSLSVLPDSAQKAELMRELAPFIPEANLLNQAIAISEKIEDHRGIALGYLAQGQNQLLAKNYGEALDITQKAIANASVNLSSDILYQAWFNSAQVNILLGNRTEARDDFKRAIKSLQSLRSASSDSTIFRLNYRKEIEPIYRGYLELLLDNPVDSNLVEAIQVFELMQVSDLESFFGDRCVEEIENNPKPLEVLANTNSVAIYAISTNSHLHVVMLLPTGDFKHHQVNINNIELDEKLKEWRYNLEDYSTNRYLETSRWLYDQMIRPLSKELIEIDPNAIVFLGDRFFRNVPLEALYDGERFLVEKYPLAISLGLQFNDYRENLKKHKQTSIFALSVEKPPFGELRYAEAEANEIAKIIEDSEKFLNNQFTKKRLIEEIEKENDLSKLHLISHGNFAGSLDNSYLQTFDETISLREFEEILSKDELLLDLIVLSACQTSTGNQRSLLGLAGISVRGSSQSTLGSLWFVNDEKTSELMVHFYKFLSEPNMTKVEALQKAKLKLINSNAQNQHPQLWSSFIFVGKWF